ncbi:hypothetical protein [Niabella hibiscisoli]|uniref:hypothetical protein n=1 Tax=Niabella hibiscisoli TaxID=1825928 RepID=UPI001F107D87|nr:hypothetical protein [Niabella hibiscisoli]MCH5718915.1 hypothetical protein [Niabella hibiscisoli]
MKKVFVVVSSMLVLCLLYSYTPKAKAFPCDHTIPATFYCGTGDQLKLVFDDVSNPATGNVHIYDIDNNYIGDPHIDLIPTTPGSVNIEFQLIDENGPDYLGEIYGLQCQGYSYASSYVSCY